MNGLPSNRGLANFHGCLRALYLKVSRQSCDHWFLSRKSTCNELYIPPKLFWVYKSISCITFYTKFLQEDFIVLMLLFDLYLWKELWLYLFASFYQKSLKHVILSHLDVPFLIHWLPVINKASNFLYMWYSSCVLPSSDSFFFVPWKGVLVSLLQHKRICFNLDVGAQCEC